MSEPINSTNPAEEKEMSPEEIKQMRLNLIRYYKEQNEVLKLQSEFESHQAAIAENMTKTLMNKIRFAQLMQGPPKDPVEGDLNPDGSKKRTLKKEV